MPYADNQAIAKAFEEVASLLDAQSANPFRVQAYRKAADSIRSTPTPLTLIYEQKGKDKFREIPGIGPTLATALEYFVKTGRYPMLERLRGDSRPDAVLRTIPSIGKKTEAELKSHLGIHTLRELEYALNAGTLAQVPGIGPRRLAMIRKALETRDFDDRIPVEVENDETSRAGVEELLLLDQQFRDLAAAGTLPHLPADECDVTDGPRPIWHTMRNERDYTICFSSGRSFRHHHILPSARDAVTICLDGQEEEGCWTLFTSRSGPMAGRRVIRGREVDCLRHYDNQDKSAQARRQTVEVLRRAQKEIEDRTRSVKI